ncbi:succinyl- synthetase subunit alpha [Fusarium longipes]|uniref:Succinyl-synthetase subunit alpha n=1 Tax=Fusarium longipes TaxID=694270 RepID=A0A395T2Q3_9HYPO|nr:succinyl- synthetase subunit alpha [Fusarium longipes]
MDLGGVTKDPKIDTHLGLPLFGSAREAAEKLKPDVSAVFVRGSLAAGAIIDAIEAEIPLIVSVAEHVPVHDMFRVHEVLRTQSKSRLVGPNCPGIIAPEQCRVGIMPYKQYTRGCVGIVSKSGTLSYEAVGSTSRPGLGQSLVIGMGGDMIPGTSLADALRLFFEHEETKGIIVIGEIGGEAEIEAADLIRKYRKTTPNPKPIIAMVAGRTSPDNKTMGHAGAIYRAGTDPTASEKVRALENAGAIIVPHPGVMGINSILDVAFLSISRKHWPSRYSLSNKPSSHRDNGGWNVIKTRSRSAIAQDLEWSSEEDNPRALFKEQSLTGPRDYVVIKSKEEARGHAMEIFPVEARHYAKGELQPRMPVYVQELIRSDRHWHLTMDVDRKACRPIVRIRDKRGHFKKDYLFNLSDSEQRILDMIREMQIDLGLSETSMPSFQKAVRALHNLFKEAHAISLEVDLLRQSHNGKILCANSHFLFDDDAPKRARKNYTSLREPNFENKSELYAEAFGLVYVKMDGNIGTVVNGAGLAMATNDAIHLYGGSSANFLDAGGQATKETMQEAFKIVIDDEQVRTIFVNIYGGITRCDMIAESIIAAVSQLGPLQVPMVVRLQGTNSSEGLKLLEEANLGIHVEADFGKAAKKAVELAEETEAPGIRRKTITKESLHGVEKLQRMKARKAKKREEKKRTKRRDRMEVLNKTSNEDK